MGQLNRDIEVIAQIGQCQRAGQFIGRPGPEGDELGLEQPGALDGERQRLSALGKFIVIAQRDVISQLFRPVGDALRRLPDLTGWGLGGGVGAAGQSGQQQYRRGQCQGAPPGLAQVQHMENTLFGGGHSKGQRGAITPPPGAEGQQRAAVILLLFRAQRPQCGLVAAHFHVLLHQFEPQPHQRVEPVEGGGEQGDEPDQRVMAAQVAALMGQHMGAALLAQPAGQIDLRAQHTQHEGTGNVVAHPGAVLCADGGSGPAAQTEVLVQVPTQQKGQTGQPDDGGHRQPVHAVGNGRLCGGCGSVVGGSLCGGASGGGHGVGCSRGGTGCRRRLHTGKGARRGRSCLRGTLRIEKADGSPGHAAAPGGAVQEGQIVETERRGQGGGADQPEQRHRPEGIGPALRCPPQGKAEQQHQQNHRDRFQAHGQYAGKNALQQFHTVTPCVDR